MPYRVGMTVQTRASGFMDYIYKDDGRDWVLVARKLEEVVAWEPQKVDSAVELGNAYLRLGDGKRAVEAYRRLLDQKMKPLDALTQRQLESQIALITASNDPAKIPPMRDPWLE